jgi:hypothetical protein
VYLDPLVYDKVNEKSSPELKNASNWIVVVSTCGNDKPIPDQLRGGNKSYNN